MFYKKVFFKKVNEIYREKTVPESLFNKLQAAAVKFIKNNNEKMKKSMLS